MATPSTTEFVPTDSVEIRNRLEQNLQERKDILHELEPRALPTVDPIAYQTAASHRLVVTQLTAALDRLDAGTYGRCVRCDGQIASARLAVIPHAAACIACHDHVAAPRIRA